MSLSTDSPDALIPGEAWARRIEPFIWRTAAQRFGKYLSRQAPLVKQILETSRRYNDPEAFTPAAGRGDLDLLCRLVFFTMADLPKAFYPLAELSGRGGLLPEAVRAHQRPLSVLDVGAGCGALTLGLLGLLDAQGEAPLLEVEALDRDRAALQMMSGVISRARRAGIIPAAASLQIRQQDLTASLKLDRRYDLILAGNVLNELPLRRQQTLVQELLRHLGQGGHLLIIEPALRRTARALHQLRDGLLASGAATVFAPCVRRGPCPMLSGERDWCHERRTWQPPPELQRLASASGFRRGALKWSYLTLNRHGATLVGDPANSWRVVSKPLRSKGKLEIFLCGEEGRQRVTRLQRHRSAANQDFSRLRRGCLAHIRGLQQGGGALRINEQAEVSCEDPSRINY